MNTDKYTPKQNQNISVYPCSSVVKKSRAKQDVERISFVDPVRVTLSIMKNTIVLFFSIILISSFARAAEGKISVAKVDFSEIEDLLRTVVLAEPGRQDLRTRYELGKAESDGAQKKMQEAIMRGEKIDPMEAASHMMNLSADKEEVEMLCEKHLLELMERLFDGKYDLILKESYRSALLYTSVPIDDVTGLLKQELLKELPKK